MSKRPIISGIQFAAWTCFIFSLHYSADVFAQDVGPDVQIDELALFRWTISALLAMVIWYARKLDTRVDVLENSVPKNLDRKLELLDGEDKNTQSLVIMLRDQMNRDHTTKADTTEHRRHVENELRELRLEIKEANREQMTRIEQLVEAFMRGR